MSIHLGKTASIVFLLCAIACHQASAHKQHVHQYIAREAYLLLRTATGGDVPLLHDHIGGLDTFYAGDSAWQRPFVTTGSWREDEEDVVFHHDWYEISPGLNYALVSISHFWDADQGDSVWNMFRLRIERPPLPPLTIDIGPYENAFEKMSWFAAGGWVLWYPRAFTATNIANGHTLTLTPLPFPAAFGVPISYSGLTAFFGSRICTLRTDQSIVYTVFDQTAGGLIDPATVSALLVDEPFRDQVVWEILGRMCHLLADMSVPAHAHRDEHGLQADSYEEYIGGPGAPYTAWHHQNVGGVLNPATGDNAPIHFLQYVTQQVADHYASNGPVDGEGNDAIAGEPRPAEVAALDSIGLASLGPPTNPSGPWTQENLTNIASHTMPLVIRATAGLLLWFSRETQLLTGTDEPSGDGLPGTISLAQNYPNPFNPRTVIRFRVTESGPVMVRVFDVLGREVGTPVNEEKAPGTYTVVFDASGLASGVYWYRLQSGTRALSRAMILAR